MSHGPPVATRRQQLGEKPVFDQHRVRFVCGGGGGGRACVRACVGVCWRAGTNLGSIDTVLVRGWPIFVRAVVQFLSDLQESSEALGVSYFFDHIQTVLELTPRSPRNPPLHNAVGPGRRVIALWLATISGSCAFTSA